MMQIYGFCDADEKPFPNIPVIAVSRLQYEDVIEDTLTDKDGRFSILISGGEYEIYLGVPLNSF